MWSIFQVLSRRLLAPGLFLFPFRSYKISAVRHFPTWPLPPLWWKLVTLYRRIAFAGAFENPQGFRAISTATSFPEIFLGAQGGDFFRHRHIDELVEGYAFRFSSLTQLHQQ